MAVRHRIPTNLMLIHIDRCRPSTSQIRMLSRRLIAGIPVILPTETQYALGCDATSESAIAAVRAIKGRGPSAPFSVFLEGINALKQWRIDCPEYAGRLAACFWPGPLTLILPTANPIFKLLGGEGRSVGVRVAPEPVIDALLRHTGHPIVATSANPTGVTMDFRAENKWLSHLAGTGQVVWARPARYVRRPASTIIDCTGVVPRELRSGPISKQQWNAALRLDV